MARSFEAYFDRPLGGISKENEVPHWCGNICYAVVGFFCKLLWRYRTHGIQHLRQFKGEGGAVLACNHTSYLDVAFLYCAARPSQWVRFMARDTLFESLGWLGAQIMARVGAFPVTRDSADRTSVKRAVRMLKNGEVVGIFPEGTRRGKTDVPIRIHGGLALIAKMGKSPIVPCGIANAEKIKEKGSLVRFPKVEMRLGQPVHYEWFESFPKERRLEACSWYVMRECFALSQGVPAEAVDMPALFPDDNDYTQDFASFEPPFPPVHEGGASK